MFLDLLVSRPGTRSRSTPGTIAVASNDRGGARGAEEGDTQVGGGRLEVKSGTSHIHVNTVHYNSDNNTYNTTPMANGSYTNRADTASKKIWGNCISINMPTTINSKEYF